MIEKIIKQIAKAFLKKSKTPPPPRDTYNGHWANKGTKKYERWEWVETKTNYKKCYICLHQFEDDFIITKRSRPSGNALETVECLSAKDEQNAIDILSAGYRKRGNIIVTVD